jgi:hypothetical protein
MIVISAFQAWNTLGFNIPKSLGFTQRLGMPPFQGWGITSKTAGKNPITQRIGLKGQDIKGMGKARSISNTH